MTSCKRSRELLELFRYDSPADWSSPQLRHLEVCQSCRLEVALDREVVRQIERALHERVDGAGPSPAAWAAIRRAAEVQSAGSRRGWLAPLRVLGRGIAFTAASTAAVVLIVFGAGRQLALPADGRAADTSVTVSGPAITAALPAGLGRIPAEQLQAPAAPDGADLVMEAELSRSAKTGDEAAGTFSDDAIVARAPTVLGPAAYLQEELITDAVVASAPQPAPTPEPGGNPV
ncbi:MAG: hypothetical protein ABR509_05535 [Candidatus Limnocylindria bacterium]